jgi:tRNA (cytidine/uridine-2'-O-)-methyltransferase
MPFHIILFEPEIPPNTGNAVRLSANSGTTLHLVRPLGFGLDDKNLQRSGLDYHDLAVVKVHENLDACLAGLAHSRIFAVETVGRNRYADVRFRPGDAFLFGPETRGLPPAILERIGRENSLFIPMLKTSRSINLSNSIAIVVYEAWRQQDFAIPSPPGLPGS